MPDIIELIDELIEREGGYVNHPADRGGPTRFGITEAVARAHGYAGPMKWLPREEAAAIDSADRESSSFFMDRLLSGCPAAKHSSRCSRWCLRESSPQSRERTGPGL